jgi:hypothetical protein
MKQLSCELLLAVMMLAAVPAIPAQTQPASADDVTARDAEWGFQNRKTFAVGDRVEADTRSIGYWRKGRVARTYLTDAGEINVYEIKFDTGETELVRADSNGVRSFGAGGTDAKDDTAAATSSPELAVTARQMYDEYHNSEAAARRKYVGKVVEVTGLVWLVQTNELARSYVALTAYGYVDSAVTCYVVDKAQLASLTKGDTISVVGTVSGAYTGSGSVSVEPCKIEVTGATAAPGNRANNRAAGDVGGVVGSWFYIALVGADGSETVLSNRQSYLNLKNDGTFEHIFGRTSQTGTYGVTGNRLTLMAENREARTYSITFGEEGKRTFGLSGNTMTLVSNDGSSYRLER